MFSRVICLIAFFGLLNEVNLTPVDSEDMKEKILAVQERVTAKVLTASLTAKEAAKLNNILEIKAADYYNAAVNKTDYKLKVELVKKITDGVKKRLVNELNQLADKTNEEAQDDLRLKKNLIDQIEEMERISEEHIKNLTALELAAKNEWETFDNETQIMIAQADKMKKEAVKAVVEALKFTAANSPDLVKNYPNLTIQEAAQKVCIDYFKNRIEKLGPGFSASSELYENMKKIWIKGQKEFVKSTA